MIPNQAIGQLANSAMPMMNAMASQFGLGAFVPSGDQPLTANPDMEGLRDCLEQTADLIEARLKDDELTGRILERLDQLSGLADDLGDMELELDKIDGVQGEIDKLTTRVEKLLENLDNYSRQKMAGVSETAELEVRLAKIDRAIDISVIEVTCVANMSSEKTLDAILEGPGAWFFWEEAFGAKTRHVTWTMFVEACQARIPSLSLTPISIQDPNSDVVSNNERAFAGLALIRKAVDPALTGFIKVLDFASFSRVLGFPESILQLMKLSAIVNVHYADNTLLRDFLMEIGPDAGHPGRTDEAEASSVQESSSVTAGQTPSEGPTTTSTGPDTIKRTQSSMGQFFEAKDPKEKVEKVVKALEEKHWVFTFGHVRSLGPMKLRQLGLPIRFVESLEQALYKLEGDSLPDDPVPLLCMGLLGDLYRRPRDLFSSGRRRRSKKEKERQAAKARRSYFFRKMFSCLNKAGSAADSAKPGSSALLGFFASMIGSGALTIVGSKALTCLAEPFEGDWPVYANILQRMKSKCLLFLVETCMYCTEDQPRDLSAKALANMFRLNNFSTDFSLYPDMRGAWEKLEMFFSGIYANRKSPAMAKAIHRYMLARVGNILQDGSDLRSAEGRLKRALELGNLALEKGDFSLVTAILSKIQQLFTAIFSEDAEVVEVHRTALTDRAFQVQEEQYCRVRQSQYEVSKARVLESQARDRLKTLESQHSEVSEQLKTLHLLGNANPSPTDDGAKQERLLEEELATVEKALEETRQAVTAAVEARRVLEKELDSTQWELWRCKEEPTVLRGGDSRSFSKVKEDLLQTCIAYISRCLQVLRYYTPTKRAAADAMERAAQQALDGDVIHTYFDWSYAAYTTLLALASPAIAADWSDVSPLEASYLHIMLGSGKWEQDPAKANFIQRSIELMHLHDDVGVIVAGFGLLRGISLALRARFESSLSSVLVILSTAQHQLSCFATLSKQLHTLLPPYEASLRTAKEALCTSTMMAQSSPKLSALLDDLQSHSATLKRLSAALNPLASSTGLNPSSGSGSATSNLTAAGLKNVPRISSSSSESLPITQDTGGHRPSQTLAGLQDLSTKLLALSNSLKFPQSNLELTLKEKLGAKAKLDSTGSRLAFTEYAILGVLSARSVSLSVLKDSAPTPVPHPTPTLSQNEAMSRSALTLSSTNRTQPPPTPTSPLLPPPPPISVNPNAPRQVVALSGSRPLPPPSTPTSSALYATHQNASPNTRTLSVTSSKSFLNFSASLFKSIFGAMEHRSEAAVSSAQSLQDTSKALLGCLKPLLGVVSALTESGHQLSSALEELKEAAEARAQLVDLFVDAQHVKFSSLIPDTLVSTSGSWSSLLLEFWLANCAQDGTVQTLTEWLIGLANEHFSNEGERTKAYSQDAADALLGSAMSLLRAASETDLAVALTKTVAEEASNRRPSLFGSLLQGPLGEAMIQGAVPSQAHKLLHTLERTKDFYKSLRAKLVDALEDVSTTLEIALGDWLNAESALIKKITRLEKLVAFAWILLRHGHEKGKAIYSNSLFFAAIDTLHVAADWYTDDPNAKVLPPQVGSQLLSRLQVCVLCLRILTGICRFLEPNRVFNKNVEDARDLLPFLRAMYARTASLDAEFTTADGPWQQIRPVVRRAELICSISDTEVLQSRGLWKGVLIDEAMRLSADLQDTLNARLARGCCSCYPSSKNPSASKPKQKVS